MHAIAELEVIEVLDVARGQLVEFLKRLGGVEDNPSGNDASDSGGEHAAGKQRELVNFAPHDDGMSRVRAPLIANDNIVVACQQVDDLAFGFVTPLQSDNTGPWHSTFLRLRGL